MSKRVLQREMSVQTILEAALELFAENGYDGTSIRQIARKAGISLGLMYNYFASKEELLKAILQKARTEAQVALAKKEALSPLEYVEHHVRSTFQMLQQNPTFWRLHHSLRLQPGISKALGPEVANEAAKEIVVLTNKLAAAGSHSPSAEAALLVATIDGIAQHYLTVPNYPLQNVVIRYLLQLKNHLKP